MNGMNDQRFSELAMKTMARQATDAERAEFEVLIASNPELKTEFEQLRSDAALARELFPISNSIGAEKGEFPAYARERLQTKVRQSFRALKTEGEARQGAFRRWWPRLATAAVLMLAISMPWLLRPASPVLELAVLDIAGPTRGGDTNQVAVLQATWPDSPVKLLSTTSESERWEQDWPPQAGRHAVKVVYDRAAGEIRVAGRAGDRIFNRTFPLEGGLSEALRKAKDFVNEQSRQR